MIPSEKVVAAVHIGEEDQEEVDTAEVPVAVRIGKAHHVAVPVMLADLHPAPIKLLRNKFKSVI
jgi:hypothetical protein